MSPDSKSNGTPEQDLWEPYVNMQRDRNAWLVVHTDALHVCNRREAFIAFQEIKAFTVSTNSDKPNLGLNETYTARGIGQAKIMSRTLDGRSHERILTDVLHVPEAFANFVSLPRLFWPAEETYRLDKRRGLAYSADGRDLAWFPPDFQGLLCLALRSETPHFPGPSAFLRHAPTINFEVHTDGFPQPHFINTASKLEMAFRHLTLLDESEVDEMERWGNEKVDLTVSDIVGVINSQVDKAQTSWETAVLSCPEERCHYRGSFAYRGTSGYAVCSNESLLKNLVPIPPKAANNPIGPAAVAKGDLVLEIARPDGSPGVPIRVDDVLFIPNWYGNYLTHTALFGPGKACEGGTFDKKTGVVKDKHGKEVAWFTKCHDDTTWVLKRPDKHTVAGTSRSLPALPLPVNHPGFHSEPHKAAEPTDEKKRRCSKIKNTGAGTLLPLTTGQSNLGAGAKWHLPWTESVAKHHDGKSGDQKNFKQSKPACPLFQNANGKENIPPGAALKGAVMPAPGTSTSRTSSQAVASAGESSIAKISTPNRKLPFEETNAVLSDLEHRFSSKESLPSSTVTPKGLPPHLAQHTEPMIIEFSRLSTKYARLAATGRLRENQVVAYYEAVLNITSRSCDLAELAAGYDGDEEEDEYAPSEHSSNCTSCPDDDELEALMDPLNPLSPTETVVAKGEDVESPVSPSTSVPVEGEDDKVPSSPSTNATIEVDDAESLVSPLKSKSNEKAAAQQEDRPAQVAPDESLRVTILRDRIAQLRTAKDKVETAPDEPAYKVAVRDTDRLLDETEKLAARLYPQGMAPPQKPSQDEAAEQKATQPLPGKTAQANVAKAKAAASGSKTTKGQQLTPFEKAARAKAADILTHLNRTQADANAARLSPTSLWDNATIKQARDTAVADLVGINRRFPIYRVDVEALLVQGAKDQASQFRRLYQDSEMAKDYDALSDTEFAEMMAAGFRWRLNQLSRQDVPSDVAEIMDSRKAIQKTSPGKDQYRVSDEFYAGEVGARYARFHPLYIQTDEGKQYATMTDQGFGLMKAQAFMSRIEEIRPQLKGLNNREYDRALLEEHSLWMGDMARTIQAWLTKRDGWVRCEGKRVTRLLCVEELVRHAEARRANGEKVSKPDRNE